MTNILCPSQYIHNLMNFDGNLLCHSRRTAEYAVILAKNNVNLFERYAQAEKTEVLQAIYDAGYLHDLGKIMYSENLLNSKEKLTASEKKVMEQHPVRTVEILACIKGFSEQSEVYQTIVKNACLYHHEKCDGSGYPYGLCKKDIPMEARVISVADVLYALTSERLYKQTWGFDEAIEYLNKMLIEWHEDELQSVFRCAYDELKTAYKTNATGSNWGAIE